MDLHRFEFVNALRTRRRWNLNATWVLIGGLGQNLQNLLNFDSVLLILWLDPENESVIVLSSSSPVQNFRTSFLLLLSPSFCDRAWIRCFSRWIRAWIVEGNGSMMKIRLNLWELCKKLHWFCWILVLEKRLGFVFLIFFSGFGSLISNWNERERWNCLWLGACWMDLPDWYSTAPFIGCHVCIWANCIVTPGLSCLRGALDWSAILKKK